MVGEYDTNANIWPLVLHFGKVTCICKEHCFFQHFFAALVHIDNNNKKYSEKKIEKQNGWLTHPNPTFKYL